MPIKFEKTQKKIIEEYGGICSDEYVSCGGNHFKLTHPVNGKVLIVKHGAPNGCRGKSNFIHSVKQWCDADADYGKTGAMKAADHTEAEAKGGSKKTKLTKYEKKMLKLSKSRK